MLHIAKHQFLLGRIIPFPLHFEAVVATCRFIYDNKHAQQSFLLASSPLVNQIELKEGASKKTPVTHCQL